MSSENDVVSTQNIHHDHLDPPSLKTCIARCCAVHSHILLRSTSTSHRGYQCHNSDELQIYKHILSIDTTYYLQPLSNCTSPCNAIRAIPNAYSISSSSSYNLLAVASRRRRDGIAIVIVTSASASFRVSSLPCCVVASSSSCGLCVVFVDLKNRRNLGLRVRWGVLHDVRRRWSGSVHEKGRV